MVRAALLRKVSHHPSQQAGVVNISKVITETYPYVAQEVPARSYIAVLEKIKKQLAVVWGYLFPALDLPPAWVASVSVCSRGLSVGIRAPCCSQLRCAERRVGVLQKDAQP